MEDGTIAVGLEVLQKFILTEAQSLLRSMQKEKVALSCLKNQKHFDFDLLVEITQQFARQFLLHYLKGSLQILSLLKRCEIFQYITPCAW